MQKSKVNLCSRRFKFLIVEYNIILLEVVHHPRVSLKFEHINIILQYAFQYIVIGTYGYYGQKSFNNIGILSPK